MELRQLQYFLAVAEEASFTRAAARAHVAQPAVSQQIGQLERELGEKLFDRGDRRVRLTPAGEAFLPHAREVLAATGRARDAVTTAQGDLAGVIRLGTIPSPPQLLLDRLAGFGQAHPRVRMLVRSGDPQELTAGVVAGSLDAAVIGSAGRRQPAGPSGQRLPAAVASATIATEPLVAAVSPDHRLAGAGEVTLAQLRDEPLATLTTGTGLRSVLEDACSEAGFVPRIRAETNDLHLLAHLAAQGLGAAVMPRSAAEPARAALAVLSLREPGLTRTMTLIWRRQGLSAAARAFMEHARPR